MRSAALADVTAFPLLVPKAGHTRDALESLFHERKLKPHYSMELDSSELLKRFVAADVGVGFISRSNVQEDVLARALCAIPISDAQIRRDLALVFRKDKALSRAALAFIDIAVKMKSTQAAVPKP
jgi:DNA-binding transcriptional LysR family regulator